jgi:hypothetical protein
VQKADFEFSGPVASLKHLLIDFVQFASFDAQDAENEIEWPFDTLKDLHIEFISLYSRLQKTDYELRTHHLSEFFKIAFSLPGMQKMISHGISTP